MFSLGVGKMRIHGHSNINNIAFETGKTET